MKFIVDELPYYEEFCPLYTICWCHDCPRHWDKYKVCSDNNPHECLFLVEASKSMNASMSINDYAEDDDYTKTVYVYVPIEVVEKLIEKHGGIKI